MAYTVPKKPPSYSSPSYEHDEDKGDSFKGGVTSQLYLNNGECSGWAASRRALGKGVVLRRIRHRKCVNQMRSALQSLIHIAPKPAGKDRDDAAWLEDAFSTP